MSVLCQEKKLIIKKICNATHDNLVISRTKISVDTKEKNLSTSVKRKKSVILNLVS